MAGLMDELIDTLSAENEVYQAIIPIAEEKTQIIIKNDLQALQQITEREQELVSKLTKLEKKRNETVKNMGIVLNRKLSDITLTNLIGLLEKQPNEQKKLIEIQEKLKATSKRVLAINAQNQAMLTESIDLVEYSMNLIRSSRMASGNNYTSKAASFDAEYNRTGMFDTKR